MTTASISYPGILTVLLRRKRLLLMSGITTACFAFAVSRILPLPVLQRRQFDR